MDLARFGSIRFFSTSEEARTFQLSVSRSAAIDTHRTLTSFTAVKASIDPRQASLTGVWSVHGLQNDVVERIAEFDDALASVDYEALVVGSIMVGFFHVQAFSWSPLTYAQDGTPETVEWTLTLVEAIP